MKRNAVSFPAAEACAVTAPRRGAGCGGFARLVFAVAVAWSVAVTGFMSDARAQNSEVQELINQVRRLQQELNTLQRQVYKSPGRRAARPGTAGAPATVVGRNITAGLSVKITQIEGELRAMTGRYEEFSHSLRQIQQRFDKLVADVDNRLGALERLGGISPGAVGAAAVLPPVPGQAVPSPPFFATGPQILGTIPQGALANRTPTPARSVLPKGTPKQQYDYAHTLIVKDQNFEEAERVLNAFIQAYPKNPLASNAHYWLGRTYFVRQNFKQAAFTFAEGFQKYPSSDKAPANLLNLGMSLARMKQTKEACTAFSRLLKNFPKATAGVKRRVQRERKRLRCR
jgi:tol-pal system protein YbgF